MLSLTAFFRECSCFFRFLAVLSLFFKSTYTQKILSRFLKISPHPFPPLSHSLIQTARTFSSFVLFGGPVLLLFFFHLFKSLFLQNPPLLLPTTTNKNIHPPPFQIIQSRKKFF
ncbi:unnamed protein product [Meloidogyne enterolobii]|uniref:Uncharacterized protein n=1 Tax=Meloidogyne enterolobii TaxID=390850 RepID=A0ACB0XR53_MELEN